MRSNKFFTTNSTNEIAPKTKRRERESCFDGYKCPWLLHKWLKSRFGISECSSPLDHNGAAGPNSAYAWAIPGRVLRDLFKILYNITTCLFCFLGSAGGCRSAPHTYIKSGSPCDWLSTWLLARSLPPFVTSQQIACSTSHSNSILLRTLSLFRLI